jgi:hypothetical protein
MHQFTKITSALVIAAGTGWISFGQPSFLHAQDTEVKAKVEVLPPQNTNQQPTEQQRSNNVEPTQINSPTPADGQGGLKVDGNANQPAMDHSAHQHQQQGSMSMAMPAEGSRVLAKATKAALGNNAIQNLSECLASTDRQRISSAQADTTQLDQTVTQLKSDWKEKYGSELSTNDLATILSPGDSQAMAGASGQIDASAGASAQASAGGSGSAGSTDEKPTDRPLTVMPMNPEGRGAGAPRVASAPPSGDAAGSIALNPQRNADAEASGLPAAPAAADGVQRNSDSPRLNDLATGGTDASSAQTASGSMQPAAGGSAAIQGGQQKTITIPASGNMQASTLNLVQEQGEWKVDIADSVDANTLSSNLNKHLQMAAGMKDQWPAQEQDAKRALTHHVAAALSEGSAGNHMGH